MSINYYQVAVAALFCALGSLHAANPESPSSQGGNETAKSAKEMGAKSREATETGKPGALDKKDHDFVVEAAKGGMKEVALGELARDKASSQGVKEFGRMMVDDHSKANDQLKAFAKQNNVQLPEGEKGSDKELTELSKLSGEAFDKAYVEVMLKDHKKDVSEFERASRSAANPELKAWIEKTLPTLRSHLDHVKMLQDQMNGKKQGA